jgi:hypothetical protein
MLGKHAHADWHWTTPHASAQRRSRCLSSLTTTQPG